MFSALRSRKVSARFHYALDRTTVRRCPWALLHIIITTNKRDSEQTAVRGSAVAVSAGRVADCVKLNARRPPTEKDNVHPPNMHLPHSLHVTSCHPCASMPHEMRVVRGEHQGVVGKVTGTNLSSKAVQLKNSLGDGPVTVEVPFTDVVLLPRPVIARPLSGGGRSTSTGQMRGVAYLPKYNYHPIEAHLHQLPSYEVYENCMSRDFTYQPRVCTVGPAAWIPLLACSTA